MILAAAITAGSTPLAWADTHSSGGGSPGAFFLFGSPPARPSAPVPVFRPTQPVPPAAGLAGVSPGQQCRQAVAAVERSAGMPARRMAAIARVESGRADGHGGVDPWPWSINVAGTDHIYDTKAEVISAVSGFRARGVQSIDVGCMQVNLMYHPDAFATLEDAFDPMINAGYAARFLAQLYAQTGSWQRATAMYHSAVPEIGEPYQRKVELALIEEQRRGDPPGQAPVVTASAGAIGPGSWLPGAGALMLGNHAEAARFLPAAPGTVGRGLDAYRSAPIPIAMRATNRAPL